MTYDSGFYDIINQGSRDSAARVVPLVMALVSPVTVIDVGCGEGIWTRTFTDAGCVAVGMDGDYVDPHRLHIPEDHFIGHDLNTPLPPLGQFDLAVSLEVAEHLTPQRADGFVRDLCVLSPVVLFSAAIPGQGGVGHINEQWPDYWVDKFNDHGYRVSGALRWEIWNDPTVENWYRQNLMVAVAGGYRPDSRVHEIMHGVMADPYPVVHPVLHDHLRSLR